MQKQDIGLIGLGVMGQNLALNINRNGFIVAGFDSNGNKLKESEEKFKDKNITFYSSLEDFFQNLESPKKIIMMIPEDEVDKLIKNLKPHLSKGDVLIDGGNSYFLDTERRNKKLKAKGILYIGTGVSGGEEGALWGPSIMPGGNKEAWDHIKSIFQAIAAKTPDGTPCCEWLGNGGAGHFVKMVHNGIEYGDMQMICEAYFLMEQVLGLTPKDMHKIFTEWNKGELNSYLIEITSNIMAKSDNETGKPMIHIILDTAGQKGTGKWASQIAMDLGVPAQTIAEAVFARMISSIKEERVDAAKQLSGPGIKFNGNKEEFVEMIRKALYASKICSYAQGYQLMRAASEKYNWNLNFGGIALLWRAGCIIRAKFLDKIKEAYDKQPELPNLLLDPYFKNAIDANQDGWRKVVAKAVELGIPLPAFSSALAYYDSYRSSRLPANLLQAMRDYFGAHMYERIDKTRGHFFHTEWT
jgi:6-phosphogluconate dehydrogenase